MDSPTGIIPEALMYPDRKREVIEWLKKAPFPADNKRNLLMGWAVTVGMRISQRDRRAVENSGIDVTYQATGTYTDPSSLP